MSGVAASPAVLEEGMRKAEGEKQKQKLLEVLSLVRMMNK
jgi:hypothetical protein